MKFTIKSGDLEEQVEGSDGFQACVRAVQDCEAASLGLVMFAIPDGSKEFADDMLLCSTERVLEAAGIEYLRKDGRPKAGEIH